MTGGGAAGPPGWGDVALAVAALAVAPERLGGLRVRGRPGPQRDRLLAWVAALAPADAPVLRLPVHVTDDRLLGGLALAETLRSGRVVTERGLLARADRGLVVAPMAERLAPGVVSHLAAALDRGAVTLEREGVTAVVRARLAVVALDEGLGDDQGVAAALADRLAFDVDLHGFHPRAMPLDDPDPGEVAAARARFADVAIPDEALDALGRTAWALGIGSLRAPLLAAHAARALAALAGRPAVAEADLAAAARLVLGPRATRFPADPPPEDAEPPEPEPPPDEAPEPETADEEEPAPVGPLDEIVLEAVKSGIPEGLLDALRLGQGSRNAPPSAGQSGATRASTTGGRPAGTLAAAPGRGARLNVVETLRAAAPWQPLRRRDGDRRVRVRREDFRVTRYRERTETAVIFAVDASGSAAMMRLAEAKGAVEQVLGDCYVRRDHVALVAFRGAEASLLLPPTRSLPRARRELAALAGGGTTPLAAGIDAARALALDARRRGRTPLVVLMTDGRANVARDGREGAADAREDALESARALRADGVSVLFLDTAPRPRRDARALAGAMDARYLPLPYLDARGISREVQALAREPGA